MEGVQYDCFKYLTLSIKKETIFFYKESVFDFPGKIVCDNSEQPVDIGLGNHDFFLNGGV